jgi:hypothetical protein
VINLKYRGNRVIVDASANSNSVPTAVLFLSGTNSVKYTKVTFTFAGEHAPSKKKRTVVSVRLLLSNTPS